MTMNERDWYAESWMCEGCGTDCSLTPADRAACTYHKLCAECLDECETGARCWVCCSSPCQCVTMDDDG